MKFCFLFLILLFPSIGFADAIEARINLSPAGDFTAKSNAVKGKALKSGNSFIAQNIVADLTKLKTGISLRDKHTQNYLETKKPGYDKAVLLKAKGKNGKAIALIQIRGQKKKYSGSYKIKGNKLHVDFDLSLSDIGITGIKYMGVGVNNTVKVSVTVPITDKK